MSVKVNLLPAEIAKGERTAQARNLAIVGVAGLAVVMAGLTFAQLNAVRDAEQRLVAAEGANQLLQARIGELAPFSALELRQNNAVANVTLGMAREGSFAGVLQDLSAVLPPTVEINVLAVTLENEPALPQPGGTRLVHGRLAVQGRALVGIAPGIERLLRDVERAAVFDNVFTTTTTVDEDDVTLFQLEAELGPEVLTGRYVIDGAVAQ